MTNSPMYDTYCRLNLHVRASSLSVIRAARRKIARKHRASRDPKIVVERKKFYRWMLDHHSAACDLVRQFRL